MNGRVERFARRWWSGQAGLVGTLLSVLLAPVSTGWGLATRLKSRRHDRHPASPVEDLSVISVGNLAVGGTGKTPFVSWVAGTVQEAGQRPAVIVGRYGSDEALLHRAWRPQLPVLTQSDRYQGAIAARQGGAHVAIVDDGFQHRRLARGLDIVLLAVEDRFPGRLLPCGPYREPPEALERADVVILTRRSGTIDDSRRLARSVAAFTASKKPPLGAVVFGPGALRPLGKQLISPCPGGGLPPDVLVVTGIARPDTFLHEVQARGGSRADLLSFRDHHTFSLRDARAARAQARNRPIIVTEKDAAKMVAFEADLGETWVVGQQLSWDWGEDEVRSRIVVFSRGDEE
ncbi:MAG: tetraacyldisaccharide 4'-kinase [Gemmatimonadetes bacterium]|nr:tetraacyldisaccharide 4'-kinase [Gemmatimonadota bacterium]MDA1104358.1 tetraacyldisaccharide 4'-kinase [Gemmatimonadota bacterium]